MPSLFRPSNEAIDRFLAEQSQHDFAYEGVGGTRDVVIPRGYDYDRCRVCLGSGENAWVAAREAILAWTMFDVGWCQLVPDPPPVPETDAVVGIAFHMVGTWWLNACRVVYVVDETTPTRRFGFAYGTLPGHLERGEERFVVEQDEEGRTWYDLSAFSRPRHLLARLGYLYARLMQKRFRNDSLAAMQRAVEQTTGAAAASPPMGAAPQ